MKKNTKCKIRNWTVEHAQKRFDYLSKKKFPKHESREMKYIKLKKLNTTFLVTGIKK